jgi:hypothetical protein
MGPLISPKINEPLVVSPRYLTYRMYRQLLKSIEHGGYFIEAWLAHTFYLGGFREGLQSKGSTSQLERSITVIQIS